MSEAERKEIEQRICISAALLIAFRKLNGIPDNASELVAEIANATSESTAMVISTVNDNVELINVMADSFIGTGQGYIFICQFGVNEVQSNIYFVQPLYHDANYGIM